MFENRHNKMLQETGDFPGGPVVKNLTCSTGHLGLIPGQGNKILHATGQLSPQWGK